MLIRLCCTICKHQGHILVVLLQRILNNILTSQCHAHKSSNWYFVDTIKLVMLLGYEAMHPIYGFHLNDLIECYLRDYV